MEAIVAVYSDWGIGCGGTQPVVISEDRKHFKEVTQGNAVLVGRNTLGDFPGGRPLRGRANIVLTDLDEEIEGAETVYSIEEALEAAKKHPRVFIIGGASVYEQFFPHTDRVFVTKIEDTPHSDVFFPNLDELPDWRITDDGGEKEQDGVKYRFLTYERK